MTTARLISPLGPYGEPVRAGILPSGDRVLEADLWTDLGVVLPDLEKWSNKKGLDLGLRWIVRRDPETNTTHTCMREGLIYNGASFKGMEWLLGDRERFEVAAVDHDGLYSMAAPFLDSNRVFWIIAQSGIQKVESWRADLCLAGLHSFGWIRWLQYRRSQ